MPKNYGPSYVAGKLWFWENIPTSPNISCLVTDFSRILWEDVVSKSDILPSLPWSGFDLYIHQFYTMQIKREINKATTKQWRSLFEMLYQENSNRERRLNSKRMTGVAPIKTAAVWWGSRGSSGKRGNPWKGLRHCGEAVCKQRECTVVQAYFPP